MALISSPIFALHKAQLGERLGLRTDGACPPFLYSSLFNWPISSSFAAATAKAFSLEKKGTEMNRMKQSR